MTANLYGKYTALDPPVEVEGLLCSGAFLFRPGPDSPDSRTLITTGVVEGVNGEEVVMQREFQTYSRLVVEGVGDSRQETYQCLMGGNIAPTKDPERGLSEAADGDSQSRRGGDTRRRIQVGDLVSYDIGGLRRSAVVVEAEAYADDPGGVNWQDGETAPQVTGLIHEVGVYQAEAFGVLDPADTGAFAFTGLWDKTNNAEMDRVEFTAPENYPADAEIAADEYWYSQETGIVRYGDIAGATLELRYALGPLSGGTVVASKDYIVDGAGDYATGADVVQRIAHEAIGNVSEVVELKRAGTDGFGRGAYEWRAGYGDDARMVAIRWTKNELVDVVYRLTEGGSLISVATLGVDTTAESSIFLFIDRAGEDVTISYDFGAATVEAGEVTFGGLLPNELATVGLAGRGVPFVFEQTTAPRDYKGAARILYRKEFEEFANAGDEATLTLPGTEAITEVFNVTTSTTMTASATGRRDTYRVDTAGEIVLYGESALDTVRVTQAAPITPPTGAGIPPVFPNTEGYADGGTDEADNRAHWRDKFRFFSASLGWFAPTAGTTLRFERAAVFEEGQASFFWDVPNGAGDWQPLSEDHFIARCADGVVFLSKDFIDARGPRLCLQARGAYWTHDGSLQARTLENLGGSVEVLDQLWSSIGFGGESLSTTIGSTGDSRAVRNTDVECAGALAKRIDYAFAYPRDLATGLADQFVANGATPPAWRSSTELILGDGFLPYTTTWRDTVIGNCSGNNLTRVDVDGLPGGAKVQRAYPYSLAGALIGNYVGSFIPSFGVESASAFDGTAQFTAPAITPGLELARLAGLGAICLEAKARVRFPGLEFYSFTHDFVLPVRTLVDGNDPSGDLSGSNLWTYNGATVYESTTNAAGSTTVITPLPDPFPSPATTGPVGFAVIGEERDTQRIADIFGNDHNVRGSRFRTIGAVSAEDTGTVGTNWKIVDFTGIINAILTDRSRATNYLLWPRVGNLPPEPGTGLAAYLTSLESTVSLDIDERAADLVAFEASVANSLARWDSLEIASIHARFRLPDGIEEDIKIPFINQPPLA